MPVRCPNHRFRAASAGRPCNRRTDIRASWPLRFCLTLTTIYCPKKIVDPCDSRKESARSPHDALAGRHPAVTPRLHCIVGIQGILLRTPLTPHPNFSAFRLECRMSVSIGLASSLQAHQATAMPLNCVYWDWPL